jgi:hypothetical protein
MAPACHRNRGAIARIPGRGGGVSDTDIDTRARIPSRTRGEPGEADRRLRRNAERYRGSGLRLVIAGAVAAIFGGVLILIASSGSWLVVAGVVIAVVAGVVAIAGIALLLAALVGAWAGRRRPFA